MSNLAAPTKKLGGKNITAGNTKRSGHGGRLINLDNLDVYNKSLFFVGTTRYRKTGGMTTTGNRGPEDLEYVHIDGVGKVYVKPKPYVIIKMLNSCNLCLKFIF